MSIPIYRFYKKSLHKFNGSKGAYQILEKLAKITKKARAIVFFKGKEIYEIIFLKRKGITTKEYEIIKEIEEEVGIKAYYYVFHHGKYEKYPLALGIVEEDYRDWDEWDQLKIKEGDP